MTQSGHFRFLSPRGDAQEHGRSVPLADLEMGAYANRTQYSLWLPGSQRIIPRRPRTQKAWPASAPHVQSSYRARMPVLHRRPPPSGLWAEKSTYSTVLPCPSISLPCLSFKDASMTTVLASMTTALLASRCASTKLVSTLLGRPPQCRATRRGRLPGNSRSGPGRCK